MQNNIKKGTTIFCEKPFAYTLNSTNDTKRCDTCFQSNDQLLKCSGCQYVYYCSRDCQRDSWYIHKLECANLKRISPKVLPAAARLMARIILKLERGGHEEKGFYDGDKFRRFKDLMSHHTNIKNDSRRMEHFVSLCGVLFQYLGKSVLPSPNELLSIYGKICINSFNILDVDCNSLGVGIYLGPSILDHSCKPNAVAIFSGTKILIRTIEDLPSLDLSLVKISYINILNTTSARRAELQGSYYFCCNCERCCKPELTAEAAACPNPSCPQPCPANAVECTECGSIFSSDFESKFNEVSEFTTRYSQEMSNMAYLDISKKCLAKQRGIFHPYNVQHVTTVETAFEASVALNNWEEAEFYGKELILGYTKYYREIHPLTGFLYMHVGKIQLTLNKLKEGYKTLEKALNILTICYGKTHSFIKNDLLPLCFDVKVQLDG